MATILPMPPNDFLRSAFAAALSSRHIFPDYAACEAALESAWGKSQLATRANNLFGRKQSLTPVYQTLDLPTKEFLHGHWTEVMAHWVSYPDWAACFEDRMALLHRLAKDYPHYRDALASTNGVDFIRNVSQSWSTDPERANKVLAIHDSHGEIFQ